MATPKRKVSYARTHKRRSHNALTFPSLAKCTRCGQQTLPHRICPSCGYYKGRQIVEVKGL